MQQLIIEYLERRSEDFHDIPLRTKHHFILPYPAKMQKFGPLVKMLTMHFKANILISRNVHKISECLEFNESLSEKHPSASGIY